MQQPTSSFRALSTALLAAAALAAGAGCGAESTFDEPGLDGGAGDGGPAEGDGGPVDPGAVAFAAAPVFDERADAIAFTSGEPVHTHGGPTTSLVGAGCPDVHKHAYLLRRAPLYGRETNTNALAWQVRAPSGVAPASASYRVVTDAGEVLGDWTTMTAGADGAFAIALHADDVPALLTREEALAVEVRFTDAMGATFTGRQCWTHHPLAAPLELGAPALASTPERLTAMRLGAAPISALTGPATARRVDVAEHRVVNHTGEVIGFTVDLTAPGGTYRKVVVDDWVLTGTQSQAYDCTDAEPALQPECFEAPLPDPADEAREGNVGALAWTFSVIPDAGGAPLPGCAQRPLGTTCALPARAAGAPAVAYRAVLSASGAVDLAATPGEDAEHTLASVPFTGTVDPAVAKRCQRKHSTFDANGDPVTTTCVSNVVYRRFRGLDLARLDLAAFELQAATATADLAPRAVAMPAGRTVPALAWDGGDADLPGPK